MKGLGFSFFFLVWARVLAAAVGFLKKSSRASRSRYLAASVFFSCVGFVVVDVDAVAVVVTVVVVVFGRDSRVRERVA